MAEVTLSRIGELLRSVLELLWNKPEGMPAKELMAYLPQVAELTEHEKGYAAPEQRAALREDRPACRPSRWCMPAGW